MSCYRRVLTLIIVDATLTGFLGFSDVLDQNKNQAKRPVLLPLRSPSKPESGRHKEPRILQSRLSNIEVFYITTKMC
jgi:hypothetical protein